MGYVHFFWNLSSYVTGAYNFINFVSLYFLLVSSHLFHCNSVQLIWFVFCIIECPPQRIRPDVIWKAKHLGAVSGQKRLIDSLYVDNPVQNCQIFTSDTLEIQYFPRNMHTILALLCFSVVWCQSVLPISFRVTSQALGQSIAPVPVKQPWRIWVNSSHEYICIDDIATTK